eukprot:12148337-Heterocapsa_arctica.AAC.1
MTLGRLWILFNHLVQLDQELKQPQGPVLQLTVGPSVYARHALECGFKELGGKVLEGRELPK